MSKDIQPIVTDLTIIRVITTGTSDRVEIAATNKVAFVANCTNGKASRLTISKDSWLLSDKEWADIVTAYVHWKRQRIPDLKFPPGHLTSGDSHPWRRVVNPSRLKGDK